VFQTKERQPESATDIARKRFREVLNRVTRSHVTNDIVDELTLCISEAVEHGEDMSDQILMVLTDMIGGNAMNTEAYAGIVLRLLDSDDCDVADAVYNFLFSSLNKWKQSFDSIVEVSEDDDFDRFCENNRLNDVRKTWSTFFGFVASAANERVVDDIRSIVEGIAMVWLISLKDKNNMYSCEQVGFCMIALFEAMEDAEKIRSAETGETVCGVVKSLAASGSKGSYPGLSNKLLFKIMDFNP
jgi:hypothetical protein